MLVQLQQWDQIYTLYEKCGDGQRNPTIADLSQYLIKSFAGLSSVCVIIDGLDECTEREELFSVITTVHSAQISSLHLIVASRRENDIQAALSTLATKTICIQSALVEGDIRKYVRTRLKENSRLEKWCQNPLVKDEIEKRLVEGANGM